MKKGWNRCPTQIRLQGGMDLLGFARKAMERSFLVLVEWCHQCPSRDGHSVPPNTTRSTRQAFSVGTTLHYHFFRDKDKPWKNESAQTERAIHPRSTKKPMFRPRHVTCSRIHQGWLQKTITKKVTKEANQQDVSL